LAGVARRAYAGLAAQGIHEEAGVVGQSQEAAHLGVGPGLEDRVLLQGRARLLDHMGDAGLRGRHQLEGYAAQERPVLPGLARVVGGEQ